MAKIDVDDKRWPVLRITFPKQFTQAEFDEHMRAVLAHAHRGEHFAIFNDALSGGHPNAKQRRQMTDAFEDPFVRRNLVAVAILINSPTLRAIAGIFAAMMPVLPAAMEHFGPADDFKAFAWLREQLRKRAERRVA